MTSKTSEDRSEKKNRSDGALPPTTSDEFIKLCDDFDFVHLIVTDIHGHPKMTVFSASHAKQLVAEGADFPVSALIRTIDGDSGLFNDRAISTYYDALIRPIFETSRACSWLGKDTNSRMLEVLAAPEWLVGGFIDADPRRIAATQIEKLQDLGLDIQWGIDCECRLFDIQNGSSGESFPSIGDFDMDNAHLTHQYERFYVELEKRIAAMGSQMKCFRLLDDPGQVNISLIPEWGIKAADDVIRLKTIVKDVAKKCGYKASFMTKTHQGHEANGFRITHSVWNLRKDAPKNVLFDQHDVDKMSDFAKQWLAGLILHTDATTAITSPTVNCYRRHHSNSGSKYSDWGIDNNTTSFSVKFRSPEELIVIEDKCSSSSVNPYLVLACTIAAGLDGVERKLNLIPDGSKEMGPLPYSFPGALEALKNDSIITSALGDLFIEWYFAVKIAEITKLKSNDISIDRKADYEKERKVYFTCV